MSYPKPITTNYQNLGGMNEKGSRYITGVMEFLNLDHFDLETPGAISKAPGFTQFLVAGTSGTVNNIWEYQKTNGFSQVIVSANTGIFAITAGRTLSPLVTGFSTSSYVDMRTFVNTLWMVNGQTQIKYQGGSLISSFGIPQPTSGFGTGFIQPGYSAYGTSSGAFISPQYVAAGIDWTGEFGPINRFSALGVLSLSGGFSTIVLGLTCPQYMRDAGVSRIAIYRNDSTTPRSSLDAFVPYYLIGVVSAGATLYFDQNNAPAGPDNVETQYLFAQYPNYFLADLDYAFQTVSAIANASSFLEIHQNSMFYAGFSLTPSTLMFSEIGQPQRVYADYNFEVRTNDGDKITAMQSVDKQLVVFKENSFHKVIGDNPDNYELVELSTDYGCISDRAVAVADGVCYFLDPKGIVKYDGSNWSVISTRVEPTFRRMNLTAARNNAVAVHYDYRNQVWFSFPVDGATQNNMTVAYDYDLNAWFIRDGFSPSALSKLEGGLNSKTVFMGTHSGMVHHFSPSFLAYNGQAFTCVAETRFMQPQGQNATANFRRIWLDSDVVTGFTGQINVTLQKDMQSTGITTMSVVQNVFQSRLEFGVAAHAMGFVFTHAHASLPCTINGWAMAHRFLRDV